MTSTSVAERGAVISKTCACCKQTKPVDDFGNAKKYKDGKNSYCKPCMRMYRKSWRDRNKEHDYQRSREWRVQNIERARKTEREWYHKNKEAAAAKRRRMYEKHREKRLEYAKNIKLERREYYTQLQRLRNANAQQACPVWANRSAIDSIYAEARRLTDLDGVMRHVDHIVPLRHHLVCGLHCEFNLQVLTISENSAKHNKFDSESFVHEIPT